MDVHHTDHRTNDRQNGGGERGRPQDRPGVGQRRGARLGAHRRAARAGGERHHPRHHLWHLDRRGGGGGLSDRPIGRVAGLGAEDGLARHAGDHRPDLPARRAGRGGEGVRALPQRAHRRADRGSPRALRHGRHRPVDGARDLVARRAAAAGGAGLGGDARPVSRRAPPKSLAGRWRPGQPGAGLAVPGAGGRRGGRGQSEQRIVAAGPPRQRQGRGAARPGDRRGRRGVADLLAVDRADSTWLGESPTGAPASWPTSSTIPAPRPPTRWRSWPGRSTSCRTASPGRVWPASRPTC